MRINLNKTNYKLLYVEDNKATRLVTTMFLEPYFSSIVEATDGREALKLYEEERPDIIISDIEMPQMNGLEFSKKIREKDKKTPIIIITAYTSVEYLLEAVTLKLIKYINKPLKETDLLEALDVAFRELESESPSVIQLDKALFYDSFNQVLSSKKRILHLSSSESKLLDILIKNRERIVSYSEIEEYIWGDKYMSFDALRSLILKTRKLVGKSVIQNISKTGYKIKLYE